MKSHLWVFPLLLIGLSVLVGTTNAISVAQPSDHLPVMGESAALERPANLVVPDESGPFIFTNPPVATPGKTLAFSPDWPGQTEFNRPQTPAAAPQEVMTQQATAIAVGSDHTCALRPAAGLSAGDITTMGCWATARTERYTPVDVIGLTSGVAAIAAGDYHTCALTTGGGGCEAPADCNKAH